MEEGSGVLLNLGAGHVAWPGWIAVDLPTDLRKLPFPNDHADGAVAIHVIEHFYEWEALDLLKEWHRVLKPGASLSLECPSLDKIFSYIALLVSKGLTQQSKFMTKYAFWGDPKYRSVPMCHRWGYFASDLIELMNLAGFQDVRYEEPRYHFPMRDMRVTGVK